MPCHPVHRALFLCLLLSQVSGCESPADVVAQPADPGVTPHTHDAADIVSGWLDDGRFSPTIRIIDRDTVRFAGVMAWGGGPLLETSDLASVFGSLPEVEARLEAVERAVADLEDGHLHDAGDIRSGTLSDTHLSGNVALLSDPVVRFAGSLGWGGGPLLASSSDLPTGEGGGSGQSFLDTRNIFTQPQTVHHRELNATLSGEPVEGSGTIGLRFERGRNTIQSPIGVTWTMNGVERWALGLDEGANPHPDFVLLYNTDYGDIFRVADGAHFQMGAGTGPTPTEHLLFLNDREGAGNENILNMQGWGDASRFIRTMDRSGGIPFAVGINGAVGIGQDAPTEDDLMLEVSGRARAQAWETVSDARLKADVQPVGTVLERLAQLQAVQFRWKASGQTDIGVLAQQVEAVFPELVTEVDGVKSVNYSGLTALLLAAVSELAAVCAVPTG